MVSWKDIIKMPSTSKAQQRLMGMAYALKSGEMDLKDASQEVKDLADSMTLKQQRCKLLQCISIT